MILSLFWDGDYSFFDYKYNIEGYYNQDYDGPARYIYMIFALVSTILLVAFLHRMKEEKVDIMLKVISIAMPILEISKISFESYWDIKTGRGFNALGLLPLYTCSLFMYVLLLAAWTKGKVQKTALSWLPTIGVAGGLSNILFIQGLKWYPFWTFCAFYSMFFHHMMLFIGLIIVTTRYHRFTIHDLYLGFIPNFIFSLLVIPLDYANDWDYMQFKDAGGVPLIEDIADKFKAAGHPFLVAIMMTFIYLLLQVIFSGLWMLLQKGIDKIDEVIFKDQIIKE